MTTFHSQSSWAIPNLWLNSGLCLATTIIVLLSGTRIYEDLVSKVQSSLSSQRQNEFMA